METIKIFWNILVFLFSITCFGGLTKITYELGMSALDLHEHGMVSLGKLNRTLVASEKPTKSSTSKSVSQKP